MNLNFIVFIFFYAVIIISTLGIGFFATKIKNLNKNHFSYGYIGLFGIFFLLIYSYISHFFISHNYLFNILLITFGLISFFFYITKNFDSNKIILLIVVFSILFFGFIVFKTHDDFGYYHFPYTYYLTQSSILIGIGNFNHGFRTPSSIFYLNSLFYLPIIKYFMFNMGAILIMGFSNLALIESILSNLRKSKYNYIFFLSLLTLVFINIFFYRISEHGTDRSAQILILLFFIELIFLINNLKIIQQISPRLFILLGIIISLKAFYVLYVIFIIPVIFYYYKNNKLELILNLFKEKYTYLFATLIICVLTINLFNSGCLIYPVAVTCLDNLIWSIPISEVNLMNDWYEQWSKAGAGPDFRVENPEIYIQNFNWISNWFKEYFFYKVSDFLLGLIFVILFFTLLFYKKNKINNTKKKNIYFLYFFIIILLLEWFYNHPSLRYGGYTLIVLIIFLPFSIILESTNLSNFIIKKNTYIVLLLVITIFLTRNVSRILDEYNKYNYIPLKEINYKVDKSYFDIHNRFEKLISNFSKCEKQNDNCLQTGEIATKKFFGKYIFYKK